MFQFRKSFSRTSLLWLCALLVLLLPQMVRATLYVIILDKQEIAIAADGKRIVYLRGELSPASMTTEKITKLGPKLAFMCSGLVEIATAEVDIRPSEIARALYWGYAHPIKGSRVPPMNELTHEFGKAITDQLDKLSPEVRNQMLALKQQLGGETPQIFECMFAGVDADSTLKAETVDVYTSGASGGVPHFAYHAEEALGSESRHIMLSGQVAALQAGFQDPQSPIAELSVFRDWVEAFQQRRLDSPRTAEALIALAIKYSSRGGKQPIGYPIHVYTINRKEGFKKLKIVREGHAASLPH